MELKDFVAETLNEIIDGVMIAQQHAKDEQTGAIINQPSGGSRARKSQMIEFDIVVTQTDSGKAKAGIGVFFASVGLGGQTQYDTTASAMNRIKFSIPVLLPCQE